MCLILRYDTPKWAARKLAASLWNMSAKGLTPILEMPDRHPDSMVFRNSRGIESAEEPSH